MPIERVQTTFFQDPLWAESLADLVLPEQLERARAARLFRVWAPACGMGEELYSVSVLLAQALPDGDDWSIFLTGTDTDDARLNRARRAAYAEGALRAFTREERACYFRYNPNTRRYGLRERYIRNAHFGYRTLVDVTSAAPTPGSFELILCPDSVSALPVSEQRAVFGYFTQVLSERGVVVARKQIEGVETMHRAFHAGLVAHHKGSVSQPVSTLPSSERPTARPPAPSSDWSRALSNERSVA
ncbi:MAG TPA: CheR family methyltransferase [Polyangiaceae bacterium]|nr:CheR family methyltransferase [Polyangiaceae bacterium]